MLQTVTKESRKDVRPKPRDGFILEFGFYAMLFMTTLLFGGILVSGYTFFEAAVLVFLTYIFLQYQAGSGVFNRNLQDLGGPLILLTCWLLFLSFQLIPLPVEWVKFISFNRVALLQKYLPEGISLPEWLTISLGTSNAYEQAVKLFSYAGVFIFTFVYFRRKEQFRRFLYAVAIMGTAVAVLGLVFQRIDSTKVYGLFSYWMSSPMTPFLNKNQFANYMVLTLPATLSAFFLLIERSSFSVRETVREKILWLSSKESTAPLFLSGAFFIQLYALLVTSSRGGIVAFTASILGFAALIIFRRRKWFFAAALTGIIALLFVIFSSQMIPLLQKLKIMQGYSAVDIGVNFRLFNWITAWHIFRDFIFAGVGAGEYHVIYPLYKLIPETGYDSQLRFFYAENEYFQGLAELGLAGFGILAAAYIFFIVKVLGNFSQGSGKTVFWVSLGLLCSSIAMMAHSFFDFPTHIPANMGLFAAMGGVLVGMAGSGAESQLKKEKNVSKSIIPLIIWFAAATFIFIPFLCRQYFIEQNYSKANQEIIQIRKQNRIDTGKLTRSYELFQKAKRWGGEQPRIENGLGQVFALYAVLWREDVQKKSAWLEKSEFAYKQALKLNPINAEPQYYLGWIYDQRNALGKAEIYFRHASELEPQNPFYRYVLGLNLLKQKKIDQAKPIFQETLAINKNYLGPITETGIILEK